MNFVESIRGSTIPFRLLNCKNFHFYGLNAALLVYSFFLYSVVSYWRGTSLLLEQFFHLPPRGGSPINDCEDDIVYKHQA